MAKIKITQTRSIIGAPARQRRILAALGIKKMGYTVEKEETPVILGMVEKVRHLVTVEK